MTKWIELREKIRKIYGKHNRLILAVVKFILALFLFLLINHYVGYMEKLHHVYIAVALALICAMLPVNMTVLLAAVFTVVHLYALSMEVAVTALLIFLLMFFLYFRFSPKNGYEVVLMPITFVCRIPYAVPVANGLIGEPSSMISVIFGTILYYFLNGIHNNASLLKGVQGGESADNKFVVSLNQVLANKDVSGHSRILPCSHRGLQYQTKSRGICLEYSDWSRNFNGIHCALCRLSGAWDFRKDPVAGVWFDLIDRDWIFN